SQADSAGSIPVTRSTPSSQRPELHLASPVHDPLPRSVGQAWGCRTAAGPTTREHLMVPADL
ncbi:MAG: hypothetical protein ACM3ML_04275, partial [Micromonosporaceae bacterium]